MRSSEKPCIWEVTVALARGYGTQTLHRYKPLGPATLLREVTGHTQRSLCPRMFCRALSQRQKAPNNRDVDNKKARRATARGHTAQNEPRRMATQRRKVLL